MESTIKGSQPFTSLTVTDTSAKDRVRVTLETGGQQYRILVNKSELKRLIKA